METAPVQILILEDDAAIRDLLRVYLACFGFAVQSLDSPEPALRRLRENPAEFALAVVDGTIAGSDPSALAADLLAASPYLRLLVASGYPLDIAAVEAAAPGRVAFIPKPFSPEMLAAAVRRLLGEKEEGV